MPPGAAPRLGAALAAPSCARRGPAGVSRLGVFRLGVSRSGVSRSGGHLPWLLPGSNTELRSPSPPLAASCPPRPRRPAGAPPPASTSFPPPRGGGGCLGVPSSRSGFAPSPAFKQPPLSFAPRAIFFLLKSHRRGGQGKGETL